jgi:hypothetical protein
VTDSEAVSILDPHEKPPEVVESGGPWPFTTRQVYRLEDKSQKIWLSRLHRKQETSNTQKAAVSGISDWLWAPSLMNWWIGTVFALGAFLFALGSVLSLNPEIVRWLSLTTTQVGVVFFAGSIPFTTAAYLQLYQSANAPDIDQRNTAAPGRTKIFGWKPRDIGWLSCAFQFPGTVLFNINTFDALVPGLNWWQQDIAVWTPNIIGSILFIASGYLAFVETCHKHLAWRPRELSWWITLLNLLGCIGFMIAAIYGVVPKGDTSPVFPMLSTAFILQGAVCFFLGSVLMLPEIAVVSKYKVSTNS